MIHTPADATPQLVQAVSRAGLDRDDGPELIAGELDDDTMAMAAAVFSSSAPTGALADAPRYDAASLAELAKVA